MRVARLLLAAAAAVVLIGGPASAASYDHPEIVQTIHLLANGDASVDELRTFRFAGSFTWAEIERSTRGQYGTYGLDYAGVWDADTGQAYPYETRRAGARVTLRWQYQAQDTTKRFRIRYRIRDAVQRYGDVAQFYWKAIEDDHAPIARVRITVVPPRASPRLFKVFVHSQAYPGELRIADDFASATVTQANVPTTSFVEVRVLLDPALFPSTPVRAGQTHESLLADERRHARRELRTGTRLLVGIGGAALLVAALIAGYVWTYARYGREPAVPYDAIYEREPPRDLPPAVVPAILTQGGVRHGELPKAFAATLLEAARLGYLEIEEVQGRGLLGTALFRDTDLVYRLTDRGRALLAGQPTSQGRQRPLQPFEVEVLRAVFERAGDGTVATSDQIETWGRKVVGHRSNFLRFIEAWGPTLRSWFERTHFTLDDATSERAKAIFIGTTVAVVALAPFVLGLGSAMLFAVPVGAVLVVLSMKGLSRRTPEAALEVKRWAAFRRFLTDFSAMKDAGPQLLHLWDHYLVYATALGVAERVLENLTLLAREHGQSPPAARWFRPAGTGRPADAASFGSLQSLTRSFANFQGLARALWSTSSSGGGFSRGGGGGGGGGRSRAG
jgi:uncharacterized membrane protein